MLIVAMGLSPYFSRKVGGPIDAAIALTAPKNRAS
jgi:hypothetical protein